MASADAPATRLDPDRCLPLTPGADLRAGVASSVERLFQRGGGLFYCRFNYCVTRQLRLALVVCQSFSRHSSPNFGKESLKSRRVTCLLRTTARSLGINQNNLSKVTSLGVSTWRAFNSAATERADIPANSERIGAMARARSRTPADGPRVRMLAVRNIPKSGRTANDVLAYVHLSVAEIVQAAKSLTRPSVRRRARDHVELPRALMGGERFGADNWRPGRAIAIWLAQIRAIQITTRFPALHGAPVHFGDPAQIGISDIAKPDYGDAVPHSARRSPGILGVRRDTAIDHSAIAA